MVAKLNGSATITDLNDFFNNKFQGGPWPADAPGDVVGGIGDLKPGTAYLTWKNLPAGHYGYLSTSGNSPNDDFSKSTASSTSANENCSTRVGPGISPGPLAFSSC